MLLAVFPAHAASPFYLTAEHSFSSEEQPKVRLDFTATDKPMIVRVLRPKNLEKFLDGQLNISRSYEEPVSQLNPGHYFVKGLNQTESPLRLLRRLLDTEFRKSLQGTPLSGAIRSTTDDDLASVPEQIIVAPPSGFEVTRETVLDLQKGGESAQDLGWWFWQGGWNEDRYKVRQLVLDPLPDGVYLVQAVQGKTEAQCLIQVSSVSVQVKQSSEQLLVRVMSRGLEPVSGAKVSYRDGRGKWLALPGATDADGETAFANPEGVLDGKLVVKVQIPSSGREALTATDFLPTQTKDDSVFVVTDRPIFKPGDTFHYKGVVRAFANGQLKVPQFQSSQANVSLIQADGAASGLQATVPLSEFGSFSGKFDLEEAQAPGLYRLIAEVDRKPYGGEFRVRDYVKPTFYLELVERSPVVTPGQPFTVKFRAKRYSGGSPQDTKFEVFLYRKKFEAPQFVTEAGGGLSAGNDYFGQVKSASPLTQPQRLFSSIEQREATEAANTWESAPAIDAGGDAAYEFTVPASDKDKAPQEWIYTLMVRAQDHAGGQAILTENIYATLSEAQPALRFSKTVAATGDADVKLLIQSSYADGKPAPNGAGVVDVSLEQPGSPASSLVKLPFTTDVQGRLELAVPALTARGRLTAVARLETLDGKAMTQPSQSLPTWLIVAGDKGEAVADNPELELYTPTTVLSPGDTAKVFALLPKGWGKNESGPVWETIAGAKIFHTQGASVQGRSRWFEVTAKPEYGTGFYHTVTVPVAGGKYQEKTLGFRIVPKEKRLAIAIAPDRMEAEPLKPTQVRFEVKNSDGQPAANTELAVSIVDRAVYAVQAEFRPGIFDFFYPLQRINLSTFYSDELQGYGYADLLKKPNFALSALKSQSKLAKKAMRDTAGWFPHVVTDAQGRATVTVDMPANVTEWLVTAIAADQEGRVGETTGKFRTVTDISTEMLGPQFLREGEEATVRLKLVNHLPQAVGLDADVEVTSGLDLLPPLPTGAGGGEGSGGPARKFTLTEKGEALWPLRVAAGEGSGAGSVKIALKPQENVHVGGAEEFEIPLKSAALEQVFAGEQEGSILRTDLPDSGKVRSLQIQVSSGLLGAALQAAATLVQYPYGCTEQLVHSTVPNLVLLDLLKHAGIQREALGPLAPVLGKAEANAALGIRKIVQNQKADGGFGLWPSDSEASEPVTVTALYALKIAQELQIEGAARAFDKGSEWLGGRIDQPGKNSGMNNGYVLARLAELDIYQQPWDQQIAFVENVRKNPNASLADLVNSLRLLAAHNDKSWSSFSQKFKDKAVRQELATRLQKTLARFDPAAWSSGDAEMYRALGFGFGGAGQLSSALGVLENSGNLKPDLEAKGKAWLLDAMKNGYWTSTFDTAQVIFNSRGLLGKEAAQAAKDQADGRKIAAYAQDGARLGDLERIPGGYTARLKDPGGAERLSEIRLEGLAEGEVAYAYINADVPFASVAPHSKGLSVERTFRRITATGSGSLDLTPSSSDPSAGNPLPPGEGRVREAQQSLHIGDLIVSEVRVKRPPAARGGAQPSQFLVIEDGIPSFAEGLEADATYLADAKIQPKEDSYWNSVKQTLRYPDKTTRAAKIAPGGEFRLYQVWRVNHAGKATIPPARAFDMYDESIRGNTGAARVEAR
ncbi:MAG TPA: MG2 domain-containing protein [Methylococcaceae bacterium]|nr:MG2 domain-containing protein [Methylococcaceae bacterium]